MGAGTYYAVVYGCPDVTDGNADKLHDDNVAYALHRVLKDLDIATSYENGMQYAGIVLSTTLEHHRYQLPDGPMSIDALPTAIRAGIQPERLAAAEKTWEKARKAAAEVGLTLPEGELLWLADHD
jgi:hypothetical protein